jgi:hypothetical protein
VASCGPLERWRVVAGPGAGRGAAAAGGLAAAAGPQAGSSCAGAGPRPGAGPGAAKGLKRRRPRPPTCRVRHFGEGAPAVDGALAARQPLAHAGTHRGEALAQAEHLCAALARGRRRGRRAAARPALLQRQRLGRGELRPGAAVHGLRGRGGWRGWRCRVSRGPRLAPAWQPPAQRRGMVSWVRGSGLGGGRAGDGDGGKSGGGGRGGEAQRGGAQRSPSRQGSAGWAGRSPAGRAAPGAAAAPSPRRAWRA